jgi:hypothetical protein
LVRLYHELSNGQAALAQAALYYRSRDQMPGPARCCTGSDEDQADADGERADELHRETPLSIERSERSRIAEVVPARIISAIGVPGVPAQIWCGPC